MGNLWEDGIEEDSRLDSVSASGSGWCAKAPYEMGDEYQEAADILGRFGRLQPLEEKVPHLDLPHKLMSSIFTARCSSRVTSKETMT